MRPPSLRRCSAQAGERGFTYLGVLIAVAMIGATLALTGEVWHTSVRREKERELLFVGEQFREAIRTYYQRSPGRVKKYPKSFLELTEDSRWPVPQRHLRKVFRDPITGQTEWGIVKAPDGGIMGVYSLSGEVPLKTGNFATGEAQFEGSMSYQNWRFVYDPKSKRPGALPVPVTGAALTDALAPPKTSPVSGAAPVDAQPEQPITSESAARPEMSVVTDQPNNAGQPPAPDNPREAVLPSPGAGDDPATQ